MFVEVVEGAHVVEAIGELDDQHADVLAHRDEHLAEVLRLLLHGRGKGDALYAGEASDDLADLMAELTAQVVEGARAILDGIVKQAGGDRHVVHVEIGQDVGNLQRMDEVRLSRAPHLPAVHLGGVEVRLLDQNDVRPRLLLEDLLDEGLGAGL